MKPQIHDEAALYALFGSMVHGEISEANLTLLQKRLRAEPEVRKLWFEFTDVECGLRGLLKSEPPIALLSPAPSRPQTSIVRPMTFWPGLAWAAAAVLVFAASERFSSRQGEEGGVAAHFGAMEDVLWASPGEGFLPGESVRAGKTFELLSGSVELKFRSGAFLTMYAPAIFQVTSANGGFLTFGKVKVLATSQRAKGFAIQTPTARVVDVGTEFTASAAEDGQSRVEVRSGEVFVHVPGKKEAMRLLEGEGLSTETHQEKITVRMESGDGSDAFRLPSIEPPPRLETSGMGKDFSTARLLGSQTPASSVLLTRVEDGRMLVDLGGPISVTKINAYSWYKNGVFAGDGARVSQNFELYGSERGAVPGLNDSPAQHGWELIGRVDSDNFFGGNGSGAKGDQQACSFTAASGCLGLYRYLLCVPLNRGAELAAVTSRTLSLFDVYAEPWTF